MNKRLAVRWKFGGLSILADSAPCEVRAGFGPAKRRPTATTCSRFRTAFRSQLNEASRKRWVVYSKRPFAGPEQVLKYLPLYTHRTGIGDGRILEINESGAQVRFRYKDYAANGKKKRMRLGLGEFLRRFCLHVLPARFVKIRHYGILSNRCRKAQVDKARVLTEWIRPKVEPLVEPEAEFEEKNDTPELPVPCCPWCGSDDARCPRFPECLTKPLSESETTPRKR